MTGAAGWAGPDGAPLDPDDVADTMCDTIDALTTANAGRLLTAAGEVFVPPTA